MEALEQTLRLRGSERSWVRIMSLLLESLDKSSGGCLAHGVLAGPCTQQVIAGHRMPLWIVSQSLPNCGALCPMRLKDASSGVSEQQPAPTALVTWFRVCAAWLAQQATVCCDIPTCARCDRGPHAEGTAVSLARNIPFGFKLVNRFFLGLVWQLRLEVRTLAAGTLTLTGLQ